MKLIVIRHGESLADIFDVIEGRADFELSEKGKIQAGKMAEYILHHNNVDKIFSSTLKRAKQTADILSSKINVPVIYLAELMEFNNGKLAGLSKEVANILYPKKEYLPFDQSMYEMESLKEFRLRAESVLNYIIGNSEEDETIVIISHGGMINRLYQSFLKMDLDVSCNYPTGDTGIHQWEIIEGRNRIVDSNYLSHLNNLL